MAIRRGGGAFAALALAGLTYLWKNRKQVSNTVKELGDNVQNSLGQPQEADRTQQSTPPAYIGETKRI